MKKIILFSILSLCLITTVFAQRSGERMKNRMGNYQIAFITDKLNLTSDEAQKFWPIYNQYKDQTKKLRQEARAQKEINDMTDAEAEQFIKSSFEKDAKELDLKKEFIQKLRGLLPPKKIAQLQGLEKEFKKELLEKAKERRNAKE